MNKDIREIIKDNYFPNLKIGEEIKMNFLYCGGLFEPMLDIPYFCRIEGEEYALLYSYDIVKWHEENDCYTNDVIKITNIQLKKLSEVDQRIVHYYKNHKYSFDKKVNDIDNVKNKLKEIDKIFDIELKDKIEKAETEYEISDIIEAIYCYFNELESSMDFAEKILKNIEKNLND